MPPIAILWVPTFELVCSSFGLTFTGVDMWGGELGGRLCGELCGGSWGELCGVGELCKGNCVGAMWVSGWDCVEELCGWVGGAVRENCVWGQAHQSPDGPAIHTQLPPVLPAQGGFPTTHFPIHPSLLSPPTAAAM